MRAVTPKIVEQPKVILNNARHPLLDRDLAVPISVEIGDKYDCLIITGPNTGGKTVCLKTVGLSCLMAYCGLMIPCEKNSEIAVYDNIFCDLGDEQSIEPRKSASHTSWLRIRSVPTKSFLFRAVLPFADI